MTTVEDLERRVEALEMDMPTGREIVAHLYDLNQKFQRLEEGQQRLEHGLQRLGGKFTGLMDKSTGIENRFERLENKLDDGFFRINQKLDILLAQSKINLD